MFRLLSFLLLSIAFIAFPAFAEEPVIYFSIPTCSNCQDVEEVLVQKNISYQKIDILSDKEQYQKYLEQYKVPKEKHNRVPAIFTKDGFYIGREECLTYLGERQSQQGNPPSLLFSLVGAGLLDGLSPCAFALMILFCTTAGATRTKKQLLWLIFLFLLGSFTAYYGLGLGIGKIFDLINKKALFYVYIFTCLLTSGLIILQIHDLYFLKTNKPWKLKSLLPTKVMHFSQDFIRSFAPKAFLLSGFIVGFVLSGLEFFCTGQIYFPTLGLLADAPFSLLAFYLFIYNLAFIFPLFVVGVLIYLGKEAFSLSCSLVKYLPVIKAITILFYLFVLGYSLKQIIMLS